MNKKLFLLLFLLTAAMGLCRAQGGQLISSTCMADGVEYGTNLPVPTASTLTFKTMNDEITGYWTVSSKATDGTNVVIAKSDENIPSAEFILDTSCVKWDELYEARFIKTDFKNPSEEDYTEVGYGLEVDFISASGQTDNLYVMYYILPRRFPGKPIITGIHYTNEEYETEDWYHGILTFDVYCENANRIDADLYYLDDRPYFTIDEWKNETDSFCPVTFVFEEDEFVDGHLTYNEDHYWGAIICIRGYNKYGFGVYAAPIFTSDYITDPAALAHLKEWQISVSTDTPTFEDLRIVRSGDSVVAVADGDAVVTLEVIGIDGAKRASASGRGQAVADLTQLSPGAYVVRASDGTNVKTLKAMINE